MNNEILNNEEQSNSDKLDFYYQEKMLVHLVLKREISPGINVFLNGYVIKKLTDRIWLIKDRKIGEVRVSISEIKPYGVNEFVEEGR